MTTENTGRQSGRIRRDVAAVEARRGLVLEDSASGWVGELLRVERTAGMIVMVLEGRGGRTRAFPLGHGFLLEGNPVEIVAPTRPAATAAPARTASGSVRAAASRARVARASRIWVEGKHDAELVEKVWGDDLREEGIVVEPLGGIDDLVEAIRDFSPGPQRRLGVLVDHLVPGSKESRIARDALRVPGAPANVLVVGHPYVDVWQVIKPAVLGIDAWPVIARGQDWKTGILAGLGWPHAGPIDVARGWQRLLGSVHTYTDLEPAMLGRVEEVIDFLTATG
ncbi:hypothetical protein BGP79_15275 [Tersicoccus sp. Bi-70]|nr:hypothetical protein BGP79_15275 [Tersicoccus sp. Bi-70]